LGRSLRRSPQLKRYIIKIRVMENYIIEDTLDIHKYFSAYRAHEGLGWWFRGQANSTWKLIPKAGRDEYFLDDNRDLGRFNAWREKAIAYYPNLPKNDWEALAVAQHYGLATRLLDWTENPLVATYFAVAAEENCDGAVYIYEPNAFLDKENNSLTLFFIYDFCYPLLRALIRFTNRFYNF